MKRKDVLLVLGGVALGYLASRMNWGNRTADAVGSIATGVKDTATGIVADVKDVAVDSVKLADCQKKLIETTSTMRFASQEAKTSFEDSFTKDCLASK